MRKFNFKDTLREKNKTKQKPPALQKHVTETDFRGAEFFFCTIIVAECLLKQNIRMFISIRNEHI